MAVEVGSTTNTLSQAAERYGQNLTVNQASAVFNTAEMQSIAGALGLNWSGRLITLATFAANDVVRFIELYAAETLSIVGYISNSYGFPLAVSDGYHGASAANVFFTQAADYDRMDAVLERTLAPDVTSNSAAEQDINLNDAFGDTVRVIYGYVWRSQIYVFTVIGAFILLTLATQALQHNINSAYQS